MSDHELTELRRVNPVATEEVSPLVSGHRAALVEAMGDGRQDDRHGRPLQAVPSITSDADRPRRRFHLLGATAAAIVVLAIPAVVFTLATRSDNVVVDTPIGDLPVEDELPATDEPPAADSDDADDADVLDSDGEVFSPSPTSTPETTTTTIVAPPTTDPRPDVVADAPPTTLVESSSSSPSEQRNPTADAPIHPLPAEAPDAAAPTTTATPAPPPTAPATTPATTAAPPTDPTTPPPARDTGMPFDPTIDLLVVTLDFAHRDDGHAAVATRELATRFGLDPQVVVGTPASGGGVHEYADLMAAAWGAGWIDANDRPTAIAVAADRWLTTIDAGGVVRVAEGGVSDFTADVLREIQLRRPGFDTTSRIGVVHHSARNEEETRAGDLDVVRANTTAVRIDDGNNLNDTADLNGPSSAFETAALAGPHRDSWVAAFDYYDASSLDFSDTVTVLDVLGIGLDQIADADDFANVVISSST